MAHLIDKDVLVAEIENRIKEIAENAKCSRAPQFTLFGKKKALEDLSLYINTLEVKEVDLKKKIDEYFKGWVDYQGIDTSVTDQVGRCVTLDDIKDACRHFFELGLKVRQG